jgi:hypothetical protein
MSKKTHFTNSVQVCKSQGNFNLLKAIWFLPLLLAVFTFGCQKDSSTGTSPNAAVSSNTATTAAAKKVVAAAPLVLGTAEVFTILSETGISTTGVTSITGDIGVSPIAATAITGFGLIRAANGQYSHTPIVIGGVYAANYAAPTPAIMTTAVADMKTAFTAANDRTYPAAIVEKYAGNISGRTLPPGLYKWSTSVLISDAGVTISGTSNDVWVFDISEKLIVDNGAIVHLTGGAQAKNIFWVVSGKAVLGTTVNFSGVILSKTLISVNTGAKVTGRLLAQTAVTLIADDIKP